MYQEEFGLTYTTDSFYRIGAAVFYTLLYRNGVSPVLLHKALLWRGDQTHLALKENLCSHATTITFKNHIHMYVHHHEI